MNISIKLSVLILSAFYSVQCCYYANDGTSRIDCLSASEVKTEGNRTWLYVKVYNENRINNMKKNTFRATTELQTLIIRNFRNIEKGIFDRLTELQNLHLYEYKADEFPAGILQGLKIRELSMSDMDITHILPGTFSDLPIQVMNMHRNKLTEIKAGIFVDMTSLFDVYIVDNQINKIAPNAFANMTVLNQLSFSGNNLTTFNSEEIFGSLCDTLNNLWLDKNKMKRIEKNTLSALPKLKELHLDYNELEFIANEAFVKNLELEFLDLSNNKLTEIQLDIFPNNGLPELKVLLLHNNRLSYLHTSVFLKFPGLEYISFGANPLQCPCLDHIYGWMNHKNIERICDTVYNTGNLPSCIANKNNAKDCLYDKNVTMDLYQTYVEITKDYAILPLYCDTTDGFESAFLQNYTIFTHE